MRDPFAVDRLAERDIDGHAVVEHQHMLADQRQLAAQRADVPVAQRDAVEVDLAAIGFNKARQQIDQGRLARAGYADQRDGLARGNLQTHPIDRAHCAVPISHADSVKAQRTGGPRDHETTAGFDGCGRYQVQTTLHRGQAAGDRVGDLGQMFERRDQHQHGGNKGDKTAHRCASVRALSQRDRNHR